MNKNKKDIKVNFHSSICLCGDVYVDPLNIKRKVANAKLVFITHTHWDHLDERSINNVKTPQTLFVCTQDAKAQLLKIGVEEENIIVIKPYVNLSVANVGIETFPAYNIGKEFHPKKNGWVGYKITIDGVSYLICGDSDVTKELKKMSADVLFVPIGGTYTMDAKEAATLTNLMKPKLVVPMHYGEVVGGKEVEKIFLDNLSKEIECLTLIKG